MKIIFTAILFTAVLSQSFAQPLNQRTKDRNGNDMLIGCCTIEALMQEPYASWFLTNYTAYQIDTALASEIKKNMANKEFILFLGTWCSDSKREVPRMLKLLHYCGATTEQIKLVLVSNHANEYKQSPSHEEKGRNILRVPTLIVLQNNQELNRIVESPVESIEKDLLKILTGKTYLHNYADIQSSALASGNNK
jgi:thiol-disulfide isomerase/thioredoxin